MKGQQFGGVGIYSLTIQEARSLADLIARNPPAPDKFRDWRADRERFLRKLDQ